MLSFFAAYKEDIAAKFLREETEMDILWSLGIYRRKSDYSHLSGPFAEVEENVSIETMIS